MLALVVDPHADSRSLYCVSLRLAEWDADEAEDGVEALKKIRTDNPHAIVTETRLAGISGFELCRAVRKEPASSAATVVVVTADVSPSNIAQAHACGADAVLVKPCLPEQLVATLATLIPLSQESARRTRESARALSDFARTSRRRMEDAERALQRILSNNSAAPSVSTMHCPQCGGALLLLPSRDGAGADTPISNADTLECVAGCGTFRYDRARKRVQRLT